MVNESAQSKAHPSLSIWEWHPEQAGYRIERAAEDDSGLGDEAVLGSLDDCIPTRVHERIDQNDGSDEGVHEGCRRDFEVGDAKPPSER